MKAKKLLTEFNRVGPIFYLKENEYIKLNKSAHIAQLKENMSREGNFETGWKVISKPSRGRVLVIDKYPDKVF